MLNVIWFFLAGILLVGYAILDGFDLGVGSLHLVARKDDERRIMLNSIGPFWDGNEVWLVTFGGVLFAAFRDVYATIFSGFYTAFMMLLCALIFRGISMELRSKLPHPAWRSFWDVAFFVGSTVSTLLFGVAVGNMMLGIPVDASGECAGGFFNLLGPYQLLVGLFAVSMFALHGAIYLNMKTSGELQERLHRWIWHTFAAFLVLYVLTTIITLAVIPGATDNFQRYPLAWLVVVLNVLAIANIPRAIYSGRILQAFISSSCAIAAFIFFLGMRLFPNMVVSTIDPAYSLTIYNAASSQKTLGIMLIIAVIGMPFVLAYMSLIYWVFRGKVELGKLTY